MLTLGFTFYSIQVLGMKGLGCRALGLGLEG